MHKARPDSGCLWQCRRCGQGVPGPGESEPRVERRRRKQLRHAGGH